MRVQPLSSSVQRNPCENVPRLCRLRARHPPSPRKLAAPGLPRGGRRLGRGHSGRGLAFDRWIGGTLIVFEFALSWREAICSKARVVARGVGAKVGGGGADHAGIAALLRQAVLDEGANALYRPVSHLTSLMPSARGGVVVADQRDAVVADDTELSSTSRSWRTSSVRDSSPTRPFGRSGPR